MWGFLGNRGKGIKGTIAINTLEKWFVSYS